MSILKCLALALIVSFSAGSAGANQDAKERMLTEIDTVANVFRTMYAPKEWKKKFAGWDLQEEVNRAKARVLATNPITLKDFQVILRDMVQTTQDYHVSIRFYSTEKASLPFTVKGVNGRYFIVYIDRTKLPLSSFPFSEGDELLLMDGVPVEPLLTVLKAEIGNNVKATDQSLAEVMLTRRSGASAMDVPKGPVTLTIMKKGAKVASTIQLIWDYTPEQIASFGTIPTPNDFSTLESEFDSLKMFSPIAEQLKSEMEGDNPYAIGSRKSYVPTLGKKVWEASSSSPFDAYIYQDAKKRLIGYIRIPSFSAGAGEAAVFAETLRRMQDVTEALVIDQLNNPGGSVFYMYALASMLTDQVMTSPLHRITINQEMVANALDILEASKKINSDSSAKSALGDTLSGYPVSYGFFLFLRQYAQFQVDSWNAKQTFAGPVHLWGVEKINPHPSVRYTKPVVLLVNELDFSCGDFFPTILQDNKRVTVMGTRTAGAGGYVLSNTYRNSMGIQSFTTTGSIAERVNLNPIENLGVIPDLPYELTVEDIQNGYQNYKKAILGAVDDLIKE